MWQNYVAIGLALFALALTAYNLCRTNRWDK